MNSNSGWFFLEPYVHISCKGKHVLLFNTLNGKVIEYMDDARVSRLIRKLVSSNNLLVLTITKDYLRSNPWFSQFLKKVRLHFMGDFIEASIKGKKPVQMMQMLNVVKDANKFKKDSIRSIGEYLKPYLSEVSIYINDFCEFTCPYCIDAFKQFSFCHRKTGINSELKIETIERLLEETRNTTLNKLNILGGNIYYYSHIDRLFMLLDKIPIKKTIHTNYLHLTGDRTLLKFFLRRGMNLNILITFPLQQEIFEKSVSYFERSGHNVTFSVILQNEADLKNVQALNSRYNMSRFIFHPYFNGRNLTFFKKRVFLKRRDVFDQKPALSDIFARMKINQLNFGKIIVQSNGDVFANLNSPKIGSLYQHSLYKILYNEIYHGKSWRRLRTNVKPCNHCVFCLLCPSLSNYEFVLKRNNLCHML